MGITYLCLLYVGNIKIVFIRMKIYFWRYIIEKGGVKLKGRKK